MDQPHTNAERGDKSGSEPSLSLGKRRTRRGATPPTIEEEIGLEAATQSALRASLMDSADDERPATGPQRPATRAAKASKAKKRSVAAKQDDDDKPALPKKAATKKRAKQASKAKKVAPKAAVPKKQAKQAPARDHSPGDLVAGDPVPADFPGWLWG